MTTTHQPPHPHPVRRTLIVTGLTLVIIGYAWLLGQNYMLKDLNRSLSQQIDHLTAQFNDTHFKRLSMEQRLKDNEALIRQAKRLARDKAYEKLGGFLTAVEREAELQKKNDLFLVISFLQGRLYVKKGHETQKEYVVSLGSGGALEKDGKKWIFETPRGVFPVLDKKENPVWIKPDWAFVEKNEPIPPLDSPKRRVEGDLGRFGLYLGQGYLIHGTPPEKEPLIGLNLSHGCIRMREQDLIEVYELVKVGTKVVIR